MIARHTCDGEVAVSEVIFEKQADTNNHTSRRVYRYTYHIKSNMAATSHLEKRHDILYLLQVFDSNKKW